MFSEFKMMPEINREWKYGHRDVLCALSNSYYEAFFAKNG